MDMLVKSYKLDHRTLVFIKLIETLLRGVAVLVCMYLLPLYEVGRFGVTVTIISIFAFILGYERQVEIQRSAAGRSTFAIRKKITNAIQFFRVHYLFVLPILVTIGFLFDISYKHLILIILIVVGEHFSNQAYQAALIELKTIPLLIISAIKNTLQFITMIIYLIEAKELAAFEIIIAIWALSNLVLIIAAYLWWRIWCKKILPLDVDIQENQTVQEQYKESTIHFCMGLVAVMALQIDRLIVGAVFNNSDIGIYFRHITLAGLALQLYNIISFNRISPGIYKLSRAGLWKQSSKIVNNEFKRFFIYFILIIAVLFVLNFLLNNIAEKFNLQILPIFIMIIIVIIRAAADYQGLLLLSIDGDNDLFRNQLFALFVGAIGLFFLSKSYKLTGAFLGTTITQAIYLLLNALAVRRKCNLLVFK